MTIGNTSIDNLVRRAKLLNEVVAWVQTFDGKTKKQILDWIQEDQLRNKGIDKDGNVIGYYSLVTDFISKGKKQFNTHYTLFDTGDFYRSMYVSVFQTSIIIDADIQKIEEQKWFRNKILGLTDENLQKLIEIIQTSFLDYARKTLFGN